MEAPVDTPTGTLNRSEPLPPSDTSVKIDSTVADRADSRVLEPTNQTKLSSPPIASTRVPTPGSTPVETMAFKEINSGEKAGPNTPPVNPNINLSDLMNYPSLIPDSKQLSQEFLDNIVQESNDEDADTSIGLSDAEMSDYDAFILRSHEKKERTRKLELRTPPGGGGKKQIGDKKAAKKPRSISFSLTSDSIVPLESPIRASKPNRSPLRSAQDVASPIKALPRQPLRISWADMVEAETTRALPSDQADGILPSPQRRSSPK